MKENEFVAICGAVDSKTGESLIYKDNKFQRNKRTWVDKLFGLNKPKKMEVWGAAKFYKQAKGVRECSSIFGGRIHRWEERILIDIFTREHKFTGEQEFWYIKDNRKVYLDAGAIKDGIVVELPRWIHNKDI